MRIGSFDIGKKNFAFCIEEIELPEGLTVVPLKRRYEVDGTPTPEFAEVLERVCSSGRIVLYKNVDLTANCDARAYLDKETYYNMTDVLNEHVELWDTCDVFLIEQQMQFGAGKRNPMAQKLGQHCYSYFTFVYGRDKEVIEYPAYNKTQILGAPKVMGKKRWKAMEKPARKKWAVKKATEILTARNDPFLEELSKYKKKDDLSDVLLQALSYAVSLVG